VKKGITKPIEEKEDQDHSLAMANKKLPPYVLLNIQLRLFLLANIPSTRFSPLC